MAQDLGISGFKDKKASENWTCGLEIGRQIGPICPYRTYSLLDFAAVALAGGLGLAILLAQHRFP